MTKTRREGILSFTIENTVGGLVLARKARMNLATTKGNRVKDPEEVGQCWCCFLSPLKIRGDKIRGDKRGVMNIFLLHFVQGQVIRIRN
jgi:hypothetical protein